jgi:hypothetical protein
MSRSYYSSSLEEFLLDPNNEILGKIVRDLASNCELYEEVRTTCNAKFLVFFSVLLPK